MTAAAVARPSGAASASSLGINTNSSAAPFESKTGSSAPVITADRYILQDIAALLLPYERVAFCSRNIGTSADAENIVKLFGGEGKACFGGLARCGSLWTCPVCAAAKAYIRRDEITRAIAAWRKDNPTGSVYLATLTFSHKRKDKLALVLDRFLAAVGTLTGTRAFRRLRDHYDIKHTVRALEVTWTYANGWHVHVHMILFATLPESPLSLKDELYTSWSRALVGQGLTCDYQHGVDVVATAGAVADYIAKWGTERFDARDGKPVWGAEHELTYSHVKDSAHGYTPFAMLRNVAVLPRAEACKFAWLFQEFATCFAGRRQLTWSRGAKVALLGAGAVEDDDSEEVLAAELESRDRAIERDMEHLCDIFSHEWMAILRHKARSEVLKLAKVGDRGAVLDFIRSLVDKSAGDPRVKVARMHDIHDGAGAGLHDEPPPVAAPGRIEVGVLVPRGVRSSTTAKKHVLTPEQKARLDRSLAARPALAPVVSDPAAVWDQGPTDPLLLLRWRVAAGARLNPFEFLMAVYWASR